VVKRAETLDDVYSRDVIPTRLQHLGEVPGEEVCFSAMTDDPLIWVAAVIQVVTAALNRRVRGDLVPGAAHRAMAPHRVRRARGAGRGRLRLLHHHDLA